MTSVSQEGLSKIMGPTCDGCHSGTSISYGANINKVTKPHNVYCSMMRYDGYTLSFDMELDCYTLSLAAILSSIASRHPIQYTWFAIWDVCCLKKQHIEKSSLNPFFLEKIILFLCVWVLFYSRYSIPIPVLQNNNFRMLLEQKLA